MGGEMYRAGKAHLTVEGLWFLEWFNKGVTDPEDLCWCIEFYRGQAGWKPSQALGAMKVAKDYKEALDNVEEKE